MAKEKHEIIIEFGKFVKVFNDKVQELKSTELKKITLKMDELVKSSNTIIADNLKKKNDIKAEQKKALKEFKTAKAKLKKLGVEIPKEKIKE